jgi:hypothetical protein
MAPDALNEFEVENIAEAKAKALANSHLFDVHTWSDHPEVNAFVEPLYLQHFAGRKAEIRKKHLKVVLLDLYVTWCEDAERYTALHLSSNAYNAGSRYNELSISRKTVDVVKALNGAGLIEQEPGFYNRGDGSGRITRIRPTEALRALFDKARFGPLDVGYHEDRLAIELRDADGEQSRPIPYDPTPETDRMAAVLHDYNSLLRRTFIDIPAVGERGMAKDFEGNPVRILTSQRDKFVRRIFNRGSFELGGRFFGGWWQNCPKEFRAEIFCNDWPMTEIDYSGLHIVMLYARLGIAFWQDDLRDPYSLNLPQFVGDRDAGRAVVKSLVLMALNAKGREVAFSAFRSNAPNGSPEKRFTNEQLAEVLSAFEERHPAIREFLCKDVGVGLMRSDSDISELIFKHFTAEGVPVLCLHDSFLVPSGCEDELRQAMSNAFEKVTGVAMKKDVAMKEKAERVEVLEEHLLSNWQPYEGYEMAAEQAELIKRQNPERSIRYTRDWKAFQEWVARNAPH